MNVDMRQADDGFSLIELLLVIVVMGILAVVVVASVGGISDEADEAGCKSDAHILATAVESYFAQKSTGALVDSDGSLDGYEKTLAADGFLRAPSALHDLDIDGELVQVSGSPCTV